MNPDQLLQTIDALHAMKNIPREVIFRALEESMAAAVRKRFGEGEDLICTISRESGEVSIEDDEGVYEFEMSELGRIVAQTVKQGFTQRVREAERDVFFDKYEERVGQLISGEVQRYEGQDLVISLGDVEAHLTREDRVRGETYAPGDRTRVIIVEVRKEGSRVKIFVSRTHPDLVRRLFELEVPEIADQIIEIKRVVREPGYRTKMAVLSSDPKIDAIGACVGVRGSRIKAVIDELRGERIDIIRWSDSLETLVMNGLGPAKIHLDNIYPNIERHSVTVLVDEEQQSLAIGKRGQNVRLASRLCGWDIDIKTREEFFKDSEAEAAGNAEREVAAEAADQEEAARQAEEGDGNQEDDGIDDSTDSDAADSDAALSDDGVEEPAEADDRSEATTG
ncbi:MAG: N utilization substance protein A [Planctomycetota bacterium]|jgi:N utilization substance protein A